MKAIIVEDSRIAREGLANMLSHFDEIEIVGTADHPSTAIELIKEHHPDLLFLDIHMPGESGFDLLEKLDYMPRVIFTTAYSEYAIRSFDYNTVDYLLKPISHERLATAINKLTQEEITTVQKPSLDISSRMFVKDGEKCFLIPLETIRYFESCKNYVRIYFGSENVFLKKSLNAVEERLPKKYFFRANRQVVVNLHEVTSIKESVGDGYEISMSDGKLVEISRRNATTLKELLSF